MQATVVRLKPNPDNSFACPECKSEHPSVKGIKFESIHVLADCACPACGFEFYQVLPVGHTTGQTVSIGKTNKKLYPGDKIHSWLSTSLLKAHEGIRKDDVAVERIIYQKCERIVILNTLDSLYGHVLLKLYNSFYHLDHPENGGLVLIIPKMFEWLIPEGCAEVWIVNLKLNELMYGYESIERFVSHEFNRFNEIYLSKAYSHPDVSRVDVARLTGVQPFHLENFSRQKPMITFVLREDRWWFKSSLDYWFYRACRKLNQLSRTAGLLSKRQNQLIKKTIRLIRKDLPEAEFYVVGLGKTGSFSGYATDHRQREVNSLVETAWCEVYAKSHVVVGVHGSNMLLPTALAAGCVEILPEDRYGNMVQDLSVRYSDRLQLFFYRFADQFACPKSVVGKVVAMIRDYELFRKNMCSHPPMIILPVVDDAGH